MVAPTSLHGRRELWQLPVVPLDGHTELSLAELGVVRHQTDRPTRQHCVPVTMAVQDRDFRWTPPPELTV